jgi:hypothetical protein
MGDFGPILGPVEKAMRLHSYIKGMQFEEEARQNQRELMKLHLEQAKRDRATQDFDTALHLHSIGGMLTRPGTAGKLESALAGKGTVTTPAGQQYSLPSPEQQAERAGRITGLQKSAEMETEQQAERKAGRLVDFPIAQFLPKIQGIPATIPVNPKEIGDLVGHLRALNQRQWAHARIETDKQTGKTYFFGIDAATGEQVEKEFGTKMTPVEPKAKATGLVAQAHKALTDAQKEIDKARQGVKKTLIGEAMKPAGETSKEEKALWDAAKAAAANAAQAYPYDLESGVDEKGLPWIRPKTKGGAQSAAQPDSVPASKLAQLLNDPDVKKRGIKDINALKKDLVAHGIKVDEGN